ncbi:MAG: hypothetical protein SGILL_008117, partial [Bacillariaceae sp.]
PVKEMTQISLARLVDDATDSIRAGQDEDYDSERLAQLMLKMRRNVELYIARTGLAVDTKVPLKTRIQKFAIASAAPKNFIDAMESIRELGNTAAHQLEIEGCEELDQLACREAVSTFISQMTKFQRSGSEGDIGATELDTSHPGAPRTATNEEEEPILEIQIVEEAIVPTSSQP